MRFTHSAMPARAFFRLLPCPALPCLTPFPWFESAGFLPEVSATVPYYVPTRSCAMVRWYSSQIAAGHVCPLMMPEPTHVLHVGSRLPFGIQYELWLPLLEPSASPIPSLTAVERWTNTIGRQCCLTVSGRLVGIDRRRSNSNNTNIDHTRAHKSKRRAADDLDHPCTAKLIDLFQQQRHRPSGPCNYNSSLYRACER